MAAGGGRPRCGVDIDFETCGGIVPNLSVGKGGPGTVNAGEKREVEGGVGGE